MVAMTRTQSEARGASAESEQDSERTFMPRLVMNVPHVLQSRIHTFWTIGGGVAGGGGGGEERKRCGWWWG
jgi:hypothetical protein